MGLFDAWGRKVPITVGAAQVVGGPHSNFGWPLTPANLPSEAFDADGSFPALAGGGDWRFTSDEAGNNRLAIHVVFFTIDNNPANGTALIWVLSTSIDSSGVIWGWYNKAGETQPAVDAAFGRDATFADETIAAHFNETANNDAGGYENSTGGTDGTGISMSLSLVAGPISGNVADFDGTNDRIEFPLSPATDDDTFSLRVWANPTNLGEDHRLVSLFGPGSVTTEQAEVIWMDAGGAGDGWRSQTKDTSGTTVTLGPDSDNDATTSWQHLAHTADSSGQALLLDGSSKATGSFSGNLNDGGANDITDLIIANIWQLTGSTAYFDGAIGTLLFRWGSAAKLSDDWIATEYNSQSAPGTFATAGTPESPVAPTGNPRTLPLMGVG